MNPVEQYYLIGHQIKQLQARREKLRTQIVAGTEVPDGYSVELQQRRKQNIDHEALVALIIQKDLWDDCTVEVIDHSLVEQAYLEGKLTDSDMREIDGGGAYTEALIVKKVGDEGVQADDDSEC